MESQAEFIDLGLAFLVLALTISHPIRCSISGKNLGSTIVHRDIHTYIFGHASLCLSVLLERTLRKLLLVIQERFLRPQRRDWLPTCFAICLLLMGTESLQVDVYQQEFEPSKTIKAMDSNAVKTLVASLKDSTNGIHPLAIDWNEERNWDLVDTELDEVYALQDLQDLTQEYC
jgi:hypothetical protein